MNKILLLMCTLLFTGTLIAQSQNSESKEDDKTVFKTMQNNELQPVFIIVIDSVEYRMKNFKNSGFDPNWIQAIDVLKDEASNKRYNSNYGVVKIRVKKAFGSEALTLTEKQDSP